ncbi:hypothetical protein [Salmonella sp. s51944]|uniref:hypothetical protein n=1 Tax=unclassified Salmonella TaxID=2614656 RepID=UPI00398064C7
MELLDLVDQQEQLEIVVQSVHLELLVLQVPLVQREMVVTGEHQAQADPRDHVENQDDKEIQDFQEQED